MATLIDELKKLLDSTTQSWQQTAIKSALRSVREGKIDAAIKDNEFLAEHALSEYRPFYQQLVSLLRQYKVENEVSNTVNNFQNNANQTINESLSATAPDQSVFNDKANEYQNQAINLLEYKPFTLPKDYVIGDLVAETGITIDEVERQLGYKIVPGQVIPKGTTLYVPRIPPKSNWYIDAEGSLVAAGELTDEQLKKLQDATQGLIDSKKNEIFIGTNAAGQRVYLNLDQIINLLRTDEKRLISLIAGSLDETADKIANAINEKFKDTAKIAADLNAKLYDAISDYWNKTADNLQTVYNVLTEYVLPGLGAFLQVVSMWLPGLQGILAFFAGQFFQIWAMSHAMAIESADAVDETLGDFMKKGESALKGIEDTEKLPNVLF